MKRIALLRRTRLKPVSNKRAALNAIFARKKRAYLAQNPTCQVWLALKRDVNDLSLMLRIWSECWKPQQSVDVHHKHWSMRYYLDKSTWMPVSREAHDWIEANKKDAEARGWIIR